MSIQKYMQQMSKGDQFIAAHRCDTIFSATYILTPGWKYRTNFRAKRYSFQRIGFINLDNKMNQHNAKFMQ